MSIDKFRNTACHQEGDSAGMPRRRSQAAIVECGPDKDAEHLESSASDSDEEELMRPAKIQLALKNSVQCKVCKSTDHSAGFRGATYIDCPNKPCYLCKESGHTTATCPHKFNPGLGCNPTRGQEKYGILQMLGKRERDGKQRSIKHPESKWTVDCAITRLHHRRCQSIQFHPAKDDIVVSGDKSGELAVWNFADIDERTVHKHHRANTNCISFLRDGDGMTCATASSDGTLKTIDVEVGKGKVLLDVNAGDVRPWNSHWVTLLGMDVENERNLVVTGDSKGVLHFVDPRVCEELYACPAHGNKITCCDFNVRDTSVLLTCGNDHTAKVLDLRQLSSAGSLKEICTLNHERVVNSAYFSPLTGRKILTTCLDNRLRVWDDVSRWDMEPDKEIIHSHDFNRYLTPFRAVWDPKDLSESRILCGRYISENFNGLALHPVDILDTSDGSRLAEMIDPVMPTISPVNLFHPRLDLIVSGSSRALFVWRPVFEDEPAKKPCGDTENPDSLTQFRFLDAGLDQKKSKKR